ncbi:MAG: nucleotide-binding protein [Lawsonibacter sp.]|nr:nucleotide-binding protein [Lawsonibacter sp.]
MKKVFIGSSSKESALDKAHIIQNILHELGVSATCWADDIAFTLSHNTIDELIQATHKYDAGVFIFDKDDQITNSTDGSTRYITRDNVIAEAGMFVGVLGKESVVLCTIPGVHEISDFKGITTLQYDSKNRDKLKNKLKYWLETSVKEHTDVVGEKNVLMLPRREIHNCYSIDSRLHIRDGLYKQIRRIRIMNFASNLAINPEIGEIGHIPTKDISLSDGIEKIMSETNATVELILTQPNEYNIKDLETKIANLRAGSSGGALYSALATLYKNLSTNTIYAQRSTSTPVLFQLYVMKTSMPFGIFNVEFLGDARRLNHVKVDLYSAVLDNEDDRRSFVIWQDEDPENYQFFVHNFANIKKNPLLCEEAKLDMLKSWAEEWENLRPGVKK